MRLVKSTASRSMPTVRSMNRACELASRAHAWSPAATISRNMRCRSIESAVVRVTGRSRPPMRLATVPRSPLGRPAASQIAATRCAVVVLPLVPVTALTSRSPGRVAEEPRRDLRHGAAGRLDHDLRHRHDPAGARRRERRPLRRAPGPRSRGRRAACRGCRRRAYRGLLRRCGRRGRQTSTAESPTICNGCDPATREANSMARDGIRQASEPGPPDPSSPPVTARLSRAPLRARSSRWASANSAMSRAAGAATTPPQMGCGSSATTSTSSCGSRAGTMSTNEACSGPWRIRPARRATFCAVPVLPATL